MAIQVIPFAFPNIPGVRCAFSTRLGGHSAAPFDRANMSFDVGDHPDHVRANRQALQETLGFRFWTECRQVHGDTTLFDPTFGDAATPGSIEADGLATAEAGRALVIKTADCQPLLLAHANGRHLLALHVGWRGNRIGFIQTAIREFCEHYGLLPADLSAVRGPSLGPAASEFIHFDTEWGAAFSSWFDPKTRRVDLWQLTRDQLQAAGLPASQIYSLDLCTACLPSHFFSYRQSRTSGRMANVIWRKE
ncbi:polyphenol oxidase family protein [Megalodesulfovibrio paquesii]